MIKEQQLLIVDEFVKHKLGNDETGHDWWHIFRTTRLAEFIQSKEGGNLFIIQLTSKLHDVADWKLGQGMNIGLKEIRELLKYLQIEEKIQDYVLYIIENVSFKGANVQNTMKGIEGLIVQDADKLDAIGAIGITRTLTYGGSKGRPIWDPTQKPEMHNSFEDYKNNNSSSIQHFYEKLLLLKDRMNTETGKQIANERHKFMESFLTQFFKEWDGLDYNKFI